ncbi:hypothetical protein EYF80_066678 [Liparis tanakae]|uniref:Uncharacterized protein n=1 Tax=Liparis tanakae TaxID=230148 RepID=A0A4Z2E3H2_9TELE|nr:hypothetical protein EYF80_066678 [Liparis tanakae]
MQPTSPEVATSTSAVTASSLPPSASTPAQPLPEQWLGQLAHLRRRPCHPPARSLNSTADGNTHTRRIARLTSSQTVNHGPGASRADSSGLALPPPFTATQPGPRRAARARVSADHFRDVAAPAAAQGGRGAAVKQI